MMKKEYSIDGNNISNFKEFVQEFNKKVFKSDHWHGNIDTLDDMLDGGYGTPDESEDFTIFWENASKSREDLDANEYLMWKMKGADMRYADESFKKEIELAQSGLGMTMFMLLVNTIVNHKNIQLVLN